MALLVGQSSDRVGGPVRAAVGVPEFARRADIGDLGYRFEFEDVR